MRRGSRRLEMVPEAFVVTKQVIGLVGPRVSGGEITSRQVGSAPPERFKSKGKLSVRTVSFHHPERKFTRY